MAAHTDAKLLRVGDDLGQEVDHIRPQLISRDIVIGRQMIAHVLQQEVRAI